MFVRAGKRCVKYEDNIKEIKELLNEKGIGERERKIG